MTIVVVIFVPSAKSLCQPWNPSSQVSFWSTQTLSIHRWLNFCSNMRTRFSNLGTWWYLSCGIWRFFSWLTRSPSNDLAGGNKFLEYVVFQLPTRSLVSSSRKRLSIRPSMNVSIFVTNRVDRCAVGLGVGIAKSWAWITVFLRCTEKYPWWYHIDGKATYSPTWFSDTWWWLWLHATSLRKHRSLQSGAKESPLSSLSRLHGLSESMDSQDDDESLDWHIMSTAKQSTEMAVYKKY